MTDTFTLDRYSVRCALARNELDLADIEQMKIEFHEFATKFAARARAALYVTAADTERFLDCIEDPLSDLFYRIAAEIESDVEDDKRLLGEDA